MNGQSSAKEVAHSEILAKKTAAPPPPPPPPLPETTYEVIEDAD
jgi:hypothetical protein